MVNRDIVWLGQSMRDWGFYMMKNQPLVFSPTRNFEVVTVEGSPIGSRVVDTNTEENIPMTFNFRSVPSKLPIGDEELFLESFYEWINQGQVEYEKLYDTTKRGYFYRAWLTEVGELIRNFKGCYDISLSFSCLPYLYSDEGYEVMTIPEFSGNKTIDLYNPERYTAYPYIKVTNTQNTAGFTLGNLTVSNVDGHVIIDSEKNFIHKTADPLFNLTSGDLPVLSPGKNQLTFSSTSGSFIIEIYPRWRKK